MELTPRIDLRSLYRTMDLLVSRGRVRKHWVEAFDFTGKELEFELIS